MKEHLLLCIYIERGRGGGERATGLHLRYLSRLIDEDRHYWGVFVPIDDEAHLMKTLPDISAYIEHYKNTCICHRNEAVIQWRAFKF